MIRRIVGATTDIHVVGAAGLWTAIIDPGQLENALLNLCINARDAMPDGGRITVETVNKWLDDRTARQHDLAPGQYLSICVTDTGTGMTPEAHFGQARGAITEPADQSCIPGPKLGFYGVIDERIELDLIDAVALARPDWALVMIGPVVKIDAARLPCRSNIHWLGTRDYKDLPAYLAGWDVALMPFAINAATRFISPTKTPEYLAGGLPVVSTQITDVVRHYGEIEAVTIATDAASFVAGCEASLAMPREGDWRVQADAILKTQSWDRTHGAMQAEIERLSALPRSTVAPRREHYDTVVVGAGFAGSVIAARLAADSGQRVLVVDRRPHIGGNAFDEYDAAGVLIHRYGPHIFHTNSTEVFDYLSRFTAWHPYEHRVLADVAGQQVPMPINRTTLNALYGLDLQDDAAAEAFLSSRAEPVENIRMSEDVVVSAVGQELYRMFFRGYTRKQWGLDPSELDRSVMARVPTRTSTDDRYCPNGLLACADTADRRTADLALAAEIVAINAARAIAYGVLGLAALPESAGCRSGR